MVKRQTDVRTLVRVSLVMLAAASLVAACGAAPAGLSPEQVQVQVATSVAQTVEAQNNMGTGVASTVAAMAPAQTATTAPTEIPLFLPTLTPLATVTPFVVSQSGGSGGSGAKPATYSCSWTEVKPRFNVFSPGDAIDVKWIITNTGTKDWVAGKDFDFVSGTQMSSYTGQQLPALDSGDQITISFDANAPMEKGFYEMKFKVEGGLCFPALDIEVGKAKDP